MALDDQLVDLREEGRGEQAAPAEPDVLGAVLGLELAGDAERLPDGLIVEHLTLPGVFTEEEVRNLVEIAVERAVPRRAPDVRTAGGRDPS